MNKKEIQDWLIDQVSRLAQVSPQSIDIHEAFSNYGLGSQDVVGLSGELEEFLGRQISPTIAYEYPSISALSSHLAEPEQDDTGEAVLPSDPAAPHEPIAIIGMGCRFPGASNPQAFWHLLINGQDAITEIPESRWNAEAFFHPDSSKPGKSVSRWGGFLEHVDLFDPFFFGISPGEAKYMDPQQRLLMELSHEALDQAGLNKEMVDGSRTGVFIGISVNEYSQLQLDSPQKINSHSGTGNALSIAANRISYFFNFRGPSIAIDTACSSSLTALHLACQSLRNGECSMALAGGVNIILSPAHSIAFTKAGVLADDGRCKTFDEKANGYVRGEGGGIVVLKPLSLALADNDPVLAIIHGSAIVQDGRTNGLMAPNKESQIELLRQAYKSAGIAPQSVQYIEAHGTGTLLGDSMEAAAIGEVCGIERRDTPCFVGSVKTNIGHLEAAAGIAGLMKVVLALQHRTLPPNLHFNTPNPHIPFEQLHLKVPRQAIPWPEHRGPAVAGVSSFGFGGTNVHVVIGEADTSAISPSSIQPQTPTDFLLPLSSGSLEGLRHVARDFVSLLEQDHETPLADLCRSAGQRRGQLGFRLATTGQNREMLQNGLVAFLNEEESPNLILHEGEVGNAPPIGFVFSGQGGQWQGMGTDLLQKEPVFRAVVERVDQIIQTRFGWSVKNVLQSTDADGFYDNIEYVQPAIFTIQIALAELLIHWGIKPDAVAGHSMGEVAAAFVSGVLCLEDAVDIICLRSSKLTQLRGKGGMLVTDLSPEEAEFLLRGHEDQLSVAAVNSPASVVLSGDLEKLKDIASTLEQQNRFNRWVKVDVASHSFQVEALRQPLLADLAHIQPQSPRIPLFSSVTGTAGKDIHFDAGYWIDNLSKPVWFSRATEQMFQEGYTTFIEIGPHPVLLGAIRQTLASSPKSLQLLPAMRREEPGQATLIHTLGTLYTAGHSILWQQLYPGKVVNAKLPPVYWQRQRYWLDPSQTSNSHAWGGGLKSDHKEHPLLGRRLYLAYQPDAIVWQSEFNPEVLDFISDHKVENNQTVPATVYIEMAWQAGKEMGWHGQYELRDADFLLQLLIDEQKTPVIQSTLTKNNDGSYTFDIFSQMVRKTEWSKHASFLFIQKDKRLESVPPGNEKPFSERGFEKIQGRELYAWLDRSGLQYGPDFQNVEQVWSSEKEVWGRIIPQPGHQQSSYQLHPALLDACMQVLGAVPSVAASNALYLPVGCRHIQIHEQPVGALWSHVELDSSPQEDAQFLEADIQITDELNRPVATLSGLRLQRMARRRSEMEVDQKTWGYHLLWKEQEIPASTISSIPGQRRWLILADNSGHAEILAIELEREGDVCYVYEASGLMNADETMVREQIDALIEQIPAPLYGIVHLWSLLDPRVMGKMPLPLNQLACNSILYLIQSLSKRLTGSPRLWLVTRGAQPVHSGEKPAVDQAPLWGLGKVISFEIPELKCTRIDLDPAATQAESVAMLTKQLNTSLSEDQIAFRGDKRFVLRLAPYSFRPAFRTSSQRFTSEGCYLITGGLGGLGLVTANWMVQHGCRHLFLLGRSLPGPHALQMIAAMEKTGAKVQVVQADVEDSGQIQALFKRFGNDSPPLKGIIHAAGSLDDGAVIHLDAERMKKVMAPKTTGTWNLHEASLHQPVDFFVMFSSAVSVLGSPGQGNYAAANAYMDAMAHFRQSLGLPALSINWGPWAEVGLAAAATEKLKEQNVSTQHLIKVIELEQGMDALDHLLEASIPQVTVLPFNLKHLLELYPAAAGMSFFEAVGGNETHVGRLYARPKLRQQYVAPRNEIEKKLAELWQQTLHIDRVGIHDSFFELGGDSVLAAQVLSSARRSYGISINPQDAFQAFTIERLAALLESEIIRQIDNMDEQEVKRLLS